MDSPPLPNHPSQSTTSSPTASSPSATTPAAKPTSSKNPLLYLLITLLLTALGYFGYQNWQLQQQVNRFNEIIKVDNTPSDFSSPSPSPSADPTADWKTYTNTQYSFSFKYPTELAYLYDGIDQNGPLLIQNFDGLTSAGNQTNDFQITLYVSKDTTGKTLEQYANQTSSGDKQKVTIGSKDALKGFSIQKYEAVPSVWIQDGENFFLIQLSTAKSTNSAWFDQILSTFKFLNGDSNEDFSLLENIVIWTKPMAWSINTVDKDTYANIAMEGRLMTSTFQGKEEDYVAPLLSTTDTRLKNAGFVYDPDRSGSGVEAEVSYYTQTVNDKMRFLKISRSNPGLPTYTVFLSNSFSKNLIN